MSKDELPEALILNLALLQLINLDYVIINWIKSQASSSEKSVSNICS